MTAPSYDGFRVAITGSCHVVGMRYWTEQFLPGCTVVGWHVDALPEWSPEAIAPQAEAADLVITQWNTPNFGPVAFDALKAKHSKVVYLPLIVFPGFHPDIGSAPAGIGKSGVLRGPLDVLQSKIVLAAYHLGLPVERVPPLFNALVFHALGYLDSFAGSRDAMIKIFDESGYDLRAALEIWLRDGCFMHTDNHPHIRVLRTLTRMALEKSGLPLADVPEDVPAADALFNASRWPVYPALARRLGIPGSTEFVRPLRGLSESERGMTLEEFVRETYRLIGEAYPAGAPPFFPPTLRTAEILKSLLDTRGLSAAA